MLTRSLLLSLIRYRTYFGCVLLRQTLGTRARQMGFLQCVRKSLFVQNSVRELYRATFYCDCVQFSTISNPNRVVSNEDILEIVNVSELESESELLATVDETVTLMRLKSTCLMIQRGRNMRLTQRMKLMKGLMMVDLIFNGSLDPLYSRSKTNAVYKTSSLYTHLAKISQNAPDWCCRLLQETPPMTSQFTRKQLTENISFDIPIFTLG